MRVATLEGIQPTALKDLNEVLFKVLAGGDKIRKTSLGGVKTAAERLNVEFGSQRTPTSPPRLSAKRVAGSIGSPVTGSCVWTTPTMLFEWKPRP